MTSRIQAIVLAAGFSTRHPDKLVHPIQGTPAIIRSVQSLLESGLEPLLVLGHQVDRLEAMLRSEFADTVQLIHNEDYSLGMASSIRSGLLACNSQTEAYLIHLADKPFVRTETVKSLVDTWLEDRPGILVPEFEGMHGHPVIFSNTMREALLKLTGDSGANRLLQEMNSVVHRLSTQDAGVTMDMDKYLEQADE